MSTEKKSRDINAVIDRLRYGDSDGDDHDIAADALEVHAVEIARLRTLLRQCEPYLSDMHGNDVPLLGEVRRAGDAGGES